MQVSRDTEKQRWVVYVDPLTVASIKALAATKHQSIGATLDQAVEYFSRKVEFFEDRPLKWQLPSDW